MSYVNIEIGGKSRGLKFNKMAQLILEEKLQSNSNPVFGAYALVFAGLSANCAVKEQEPDFTFEQVSEWCDDLPDEAYIKIHEAFKATEAFKKGETYLADLEEAKKKAQPKRTRSVSTKKSH